MHRKYIEYRREEMTNEEANTLIAIWEELKIVDDNVLREVIKFIFKDSSINFDIE